VTASFDKLRIGEEIVATANPKDQQGNPVVAFGPAWGVIGTPDEILTVDPDGMEATVTAVASGTETLRVNVFDHQLNLVQGLQPVVVLDAGELVLTARAFDGCLAHWENGSLVVTPNHHAGASFTCFVEPRDIRGDGGPSYALSDGPDLSTDNGLLDFDGSPTGTGTEVLVNVLSAGSDVIRATAVTASTGAIIVGSLRVEVLALSSVVITGE
jgi:hypothetical protein